MFNQQEFNERLYNDEIVTTQSNNLRRLDGTEAGVVKMVDGSNSNGDIKKYNSGTWQ